MSRVPRTVARPRHDIPGENPEVSRLSEMVVALLGEVAVMGERLDTVERLLAATGVVPPDGIEGYTPDNAAQAQRDDKRRQLVANVLRPLREAAERQAARTKENA